MINSTKTVFYLLLISLLELSAGCSSLFSQKVTLKLNPKLNKAYFYSIKCNQVIDNEGIDNKNFWFKMEFTNLNPNGDLKCKNTIQKIVMNSSSNNFNWSFETDKPKNDSASLRRKFKLKDSEFYTSLSPKGAIKTISDLNNPLTGEDTSSNDFQDLSEDEVLRGELEDSLLKQILDISFNVYPNGSIGFKDTWKTEGNTPIDHFIFKTESIYKIKNITSDTIFLTVDSKLKPFPGNKAFKQFEGNQEGIIKIDRATGAIINSLITQNINAEIWSREGAIPYTVKGTIQVNIKN